MQESRVFISTDKQLDTLIKRLKLNITKEEHDLLVFEVYKHVDYTRSKSFGNGYDQGRFDEKIDRY